MFWNIPIGVHLRGRRHVLWHCVRVSQGFRPLHEDPPKIFALLAAAKIDPLIKLTLSRLPAGKVEGKIMLVNP
jgi:hypothetical protein